VGVQLLDGVGGGIYGAVFPIVVADLMRGTGRFNAAQGAIITAQGIGAALSTTIAGLVTAHVGYSAAFLTLAGCAAIGAILFQFAMPETRVSQHRAGTCNNESTKCALPLRPLPAHYNLSTGG
jgi:MFS family permease